MKRIVSNSCLLIFALAFCVGASAQTFAQGGGDKTSAQLETLTRKIEEQNTKIDALSQQLLKMEQQIANIRPGVMIGESTPSAPSASTAAPAGSPVVAPAVGNAHVVSKGETLTSIAKANRVGVQELQKFNQIENDRALQVGQKIMIPTPGASPVPSATAPSPNE